VTNDDLQRKLEELFTDIGSEEWRQNWVDHFTQAGQTAFTWFLHACELRRGATLLKYQMLADYNQFIEAGGMAPTRMYPYIPPLYGPYTMLAGLSLELLAKAILIERTPTLVVEGKLKPWPGSGHELVNLLKQTGITLDAADRYLAERLGELVIWAGRYPIPKRVEQMMPRPTPEGEFASVGNFQPDQDPPRIDVLWERLKTSLMQEWQTNRPEMARAWRVIESGDLYAT
jgi:hypothetical protein